MHFFILMVYLLKVCILFIFFNSFISYTYTSKSELLNFISYKLILYNLFIINTFKLNGFSKK
jgi:hypothetical protein